MKKHMLILVISTLFSAGVSVIAQADSSSGALYRWFESDGTITFSRQPPPKGSSVRFEKIERFSAQTPQGNNTAVEATPTVATKSMENGTLLPTVSTLQTGSTTLTCDELKNRVLSLEKVVSTTQDDKLMDNAVVKMAGYHNSFRRSCSGPALQTR